MEDITKTKKFHFNPGVLLFLTSFLLYVLTSPGNLPGDTEVRWSVSRNIVRGGGVSIEESFGPTRECAIGIDGKRHSLWNLGQSLCLLPFAGFGLILERLLPISANTADLAAQFLASVIFFPLVGALAIWVFYRLVLLMNYNQKTALFTAAVLGFATMHFHYAVATHEQSQTALLLLLAMLIIVRNLSKPRFLYAWLLCVVFGLSLLLRVTTVVMILPLYLIAAGTEIFKAEKPDKLKIVGKWLCAAFCGMAAFVAIVCWYNYVRFGNVFQTGHNLALDTAWGGHNLFESSPLPTLSAMLFSPGKSILLYNPVLLLIPFSIIAFYRKHKVVTLAITSATLCNFVFYSFFTTWAGDYTWSIRYQAAVLPLMILPLVRLFSKPLKTLTKTAVIALIVVSAVIQLSSVVYNFNLEFVQNPNHCILPDDYVWDWKQSHLRRRFENITIHIANKRDFSSVEVAKEEPMLLKYNRTEKNVRDAYCVNFFPFKARRMLGSYKVFYMLLSIWLIGAALFSLSAFKLTKAYLHLKSRAKTSPA